MTDFRAKVEDTQYKDALLNQNATIRPFKAFPMPNELQYEQYLKDTDLSLETVLDSPIGVYEFKRYANKFPSFTSVIEFLVEFGKISNMETPDISSTKYLLGLSLELPPQYQNQVIQLRTAFTEVFHDDEHFREDIQSEAFPLEGPPRSQDYLSMEINPRISSREFESGLLKRTATSIRGSFISPFGYSNFSFGGYKHVNRDVSVNLDTKITATMGLHEQDNIRPVSMAEGETDIEPPEEADVDPDNYLDEFFDKQFEDKLKQAELKMKIKANSVSVFADLALVLHEAVLELFGNFQDETDEFKEMVTMMWYSEQKLDPDDFLLFRDLGRGAFGVVSSAKTKTTGTLTAIKCMNKKLIKGKKARRVVVAEKAILEVLGDNPSNFTIWLKFSFQDEDYFYMALPLCTGGDMRYHLKRKKVFDDVRVKFHVAEILEGLDHLHSLNIIYRDLKPENIIFDAQGHCRISDMGLATQVKNGKTKGRAGTPGYWAPEVLSRQTYSYSADLWSLGCMFFEMLVGIMPFHPRNTNMKWNDGTLNWKVTFPYTVPDPTKKDSVKPFPELAKAVILGLLTRSRNERFDANDIRSDPYFKDLDWFKLRRHELLPPWKTRKGRIYAAHQVDIQADTVEKEFRHAKLTKEDAIQDFDYISKYSHQLDIVHVLETRDRGKLEYEGDLRGGCCFLN